jgi:hypothetical protein
MAIQATHVQRRELRDFALASSVLVATMFGLVLPWMQHRPLPRWPWALALLLALCGVLAPASLRILYRGWMGIGHAIGRITTPLVLALVFFAVLTPMAVLRRRLARPRNDGTRDSYRSATRQRSAQSMEDPF